MFGYLRNCFIDLEMYRTLILSAVLAFIPHFLGGSGKRETPKSTSDLNSALIYFLFSLFKHAFSGNKRHISSLGRQITGLWSPDIILYGQGKQKRALVEAIQSILPSSPREPNGIAYDTLFSPFFASGFFHIDCCCLFVYFITSFCSKAIWFSTCRKVYVWHGMVFLRTLTLTRSSFLDTLGKLFTALNTRQFSNPHPSLV